MENDMREEAGRTDLDALARAAYESVVENEERSHASILAAVFRVTRARAAVRLPELPGAESSAPRSTALPHDPAEGEVFEHYEVHGRIACGGMGVVLKGRDRTLGRDVAIKVLDPRHASNPALVQRFIEEAQIGGQLQHPGIVPVIDLGRCPDGRPYFAMKLVKGRTLATLLGERKDPAGDRRRFLEVFARVCQTVAYAHARSVVHRDLKPSNVMVGAFGEVQLMDWGLAKVMGQDVAAGEPVAAASGARTVIETVRSGASDSRSHAGSVMGTPAYMPPEQARGDVDQVDQRADVFALGAILCEILTGAPPYVGASLSEVRQKALAGNLTEALARLAAARLDPELDRLVRHCLAQERGDRPRDAGEVDATLSAYLASVEERMRRAEVGAVRAEARASAERRVRNRTIVAAVALVAALAVSAAVYLWSESDRRARQRRLEQGVIAALEEAQEARVHALSASGATAPAWAEAKLAAGRARALSDDGLVDGALRQRAAAMAEQVAADARAAEEAAERVARNERMREQLEAIRTLPGAEFDFDFARRRVDYAAAFCEYGIDVLALTETEALTRLEQSPIVDDLVVALDLWAGACRMTGGGEEEAVRLGRLAARVDPVPFRREMRAAYGGRQLDRLRAMASRPEALAQPPAVLEQMAVHLGWLGDTEAALDLLQRASLRYPGDFWLHYRLAYGLSQARPSRDAEALSHAHAALAIRPLSASAWNLLGILLDHLGRTEEAVDAFRRALAISPSFVYATNNLGSIQRARADYEGALALHREAIRCAPHNAESRYFLGLVHQQRGDRDSAIAAYREATALAPTHARAWSNLGLMLAEKGDEDGALKAYREALRCDDRLMPAYCNQTNLLDRAGRRTEALALVEKALAVDPRSAEAHNTHGVVLRHFGRADEAIAAFERAIELDPAATIYRNNLGGVLADRGDLEEALEAFEQAIAREPNRLLYLRNRGNVLAQMQAWDRALAAFRRAAEVAPEDGETLAKIGRVLFQLGRFEEAVAYLEKGIERLEEDPGQRAHLVSLVRTVRERVDWARKADAVLRDELEPEDAAEWMRLAGVCRTTRRLVAAARLWQGAFEADPAVATGRNLVFAARAAALAGAGVGEEAAALDAPARARWIEQAISWLRTWVAGIRVILERGNAGECRQALDSLRNVKGSEDLASLRDPAVLGLLEAPARQEWLSLWAEIESALARARP